jgi:Predicted hydrolases or acyltransferases (alpha/beta hydrolase superfamily)
MPDLKKKVLLPGAGHWIQQERPAEVNELLLQFLAGLPDGQKPQGETRRTARD